MGAAIRENPSRLQLKTMANGVSENNVHLLITGILKR